MCAALFGLIAVCSTMALPRRRPRRGGRRARAASSRNAAALEKEVQVAVRRRGDLPDALERSERAGDLLRDGARRLAQPARQLEGDRRAEVAELAVRRVLERDRRRVGDFERVERRQQARDVRAKAVVNGKNHS